MPPISLLIIVVEYWTIGLTEVMLAHFLLAKMAIWKSPENWSMKHSHSLHLSNCNALSNMKPGSEIDKKTNSHLQNTQQYSLLLFHKRDKSSPFSIKSY